MTDILGGPDAELWVNGLETAPYVQSARENLTFAGRGARGLGQTANRKAYSGAFDAATALSGLYWLNDAVESMRNMVHKQDYGADYDSAVMLMCYAGCKIGADAVATATRASSGSRVVTEGDLADVMFDFDLQGFQADGVLSSTHVSTGENPCDPPAARLQSQNLNADVEFYSTLVTAGNSGEALLMAHIDSVSGTVGTPAAAEIPWSGAGANGFITISHAGVNYGFRWLSTTSAQSTIQQINSLGPWPDGFRITATRTQTGVRLVGNLRGDGGFSLPATNAAPFNLGLTFGANIEILSVQAVTAPAGSNTYTSVGPKFHLDDREYGLPQTLFAPLYEPADRWGLRFTSTQNVSNRTVKYALSMLK